MQNKFFSSPFKKEGSMATTPSSSNAPNKPSESTQNVGGKTETNKNEGGTQTEDQKAREAAINKLGADKIASPSQEEADKLAESIKKKETKVGDRTVLTSSLESDPKPVDTEPMNLTQQLTGVPGDVDLTHGGRLAGDRSVRVKTSIEELNEEMEKTAGPNPSPNREGNELTKATNLRANMGIGPDLKAYAGDLKELLKKDSFDKADKEKIKSIADSLDA